jgi:hypothetical protein
MHHANLERDTTNIELPEKSRVISSSHGGSLYLKWNCKKSLFQQFIICIILYGFFHLIHLAVVPAAGNPVFSGVLYGIIILLVLIVISIIVINAFGTYHLIITGTTIQYHITLFGLKIGNRSMGRINIGLIRNSIGGQDNTIQIVSTKGLDIIRDLMDCFNRQAGLVPDISMAGAIISMKDEMITINVSSLSIKEKWYIEDRIFKKK